MEFLGDALTAIVGAGTGWIGSLGGRVVDYFQAKLKFAHEMDMKKLDIEQAVIKADSDNLQASYQHDKAAYSQPDLSFVDAVRGLMRPILTVSSMVLLAVIYFTLASPDERANIVTSLIYITTLTFSWWFADRRPQRGK